MTGMPETMPMASETGGVVEMGELTET